MKLNDLINTLEDMTTVVIWKGDDECPLYEGLAVDFPHNIWKQDYTVCNGLEGDTCGISIRDAAGDGTYGAIIVISVE